MDLPKDTQLISVNPCSEHSAQIALPFFFSILLFICFWLFVAAQAYLQFWRAGAAYCGGFSLVSRGLEHRLSSRHMGFVVPRHVGSSPRSGSNLCLCIGSQISYRWATREAFVLFLTTLVKNVPTKKFCLLTFPEMQPLPLGNSKFCLLVLAGQVNSIPRTTRYQSCKYPFSLDRKVYLKISNFSPHSSFIPSPF